MIVTDHLGQDIRVFAYQQRDFVVMLVRAPDRATFESVAIRRGILARDEEGNIVPVEGYDVTDCPPRIATPGEYDAEGNEIVAPVIDPKWHGNIRVYEPALSRIDARHGIPAWIVTAIMWTRFGETEPPNNAEEAKRLSDVVLIDADTIETQSMIFA